MSLSIKNENIPAGHQVIMPYLIVRDAAGLLAFLKKVFDAEEKFVVGDPKGGIMHAEVQVQGATIMFADATSTYTPVPAGLFIYVGDADAVYHRAVAEGATVIHAPEDKDYGRAAGVKDPFGNTWWITAVKVLSEKR